MNAGQMPLDLLTEAACAVELTCACGAALCVSTSPAWLTCGCGRRYRVVSYLEWQTPATAAGATL